MHALSGGAEGPGGDELRACVLLGVHRGLGEGEARVSVVQEGGDGAEDFAAEDGACSLDMMVLVGGKGKSVM